MAAVPDGVDGLGINVSLVQTTLSALGARDDETAIVKLPKSQQEEALSILEPQAEKMKAALNSGGPASELAPAAQEYLRNLLGHVAAKLESLQVSLGSAAKKPEFLMPESETGPPEIDPEQIEYSEAKDFLGQGSFGKVYTGRCRGKRVAVKVPLKQDLSDKELQEFRHEVEIMKKIFHPNCVLFMGACSRKGELKIVTELLFTDVEKLLKSKQELSLVQRVRMARDAAIGMNWLHGIVGVVHHDLKPANLLVDENLNVKITDYGFSQLKETVAAEDGTMQNEGVAKGTPLWMSPEIMTGKPFTEKCDVYAFGIILWQIYTRKEPFQHHTDFRRFRMAVCRKHERPPIPDDCPKSLSALMQRCWAPDDNDRPTFKDITLSLEHILLEALVSNERIRTFWAQHFLIPKKELQETVPWSEFVQRLYLNLNPPPGGDVEVEKIDFHKDTFNKLKSILATPNLADKYMVNIEAFSRLCTQFGDFFQPGMAGYRILDDIRQVVDKPWFHGEISKEEAERRLHQQKEGTYLVRVSRNVPDFPFTISMVGNQHRRIYHPPGQAYTFKGHRTEYFTLVNMIEDCQEPKIKAQLMFPCPDQAVDSSLWGYS